MDTEKVIMVRRARFIPVLLLAAAALAAVFVSPWWLLSIPFVAVGNLFTAPNLNLINGMPSYLSMIAGFILMRFHQPSGLAVCTGAAASFYLSALEMRIFAKPYVN
jgi:hypothetical protein